MAVDSCLWGGAYQHLILLTTDLCRAQDVVIELDKGQFFGEAALMASCSPPPHLDGADEDEIRQWRATRRKRIADVEAVQFCYLFVLAASDFGKVCASLCVAGVVRW